MDNTLYIFTYMFLEIIVLKDYTMYWLLVFIVFVSGQSLLFSKFGDSSKAILEP